MNSYYDEQVGRDMVNWQVTATTMFCDAIDEEITIMVHKDGTARCVGYKKYQRPGRETARLLKARSKQVNRVLACSGPECPQVIRYRDRLFAEEAEKGSPK